MKFPFNWEPQLKQAVWLAVVCHNPENLILNKGPWLLYCFVQILGEVPEIAMLDTAVQ